MSRELFLASGGLSAMKRYRDRGLRHVLFIPTAGHGPDEVEPDWVARDRNRLQELGFSLQVVHLAHHDSQTIGVKLTEADIVFVAGGNTYFLLQEMQRVEFSRALAAEPDLVYSGSSAGAVVAGPDIAFIGSLDDVSAAPKLSATAGLGLVEFGVMPHVDRFEFKEAIDRLQVQRPGFPIVSITDDEALVVSNGKVERVESLAVRPPMSRSAVD